MTTYHHPQPKPKMGKDPKPAHPALDPKPGLDPPRPNPASSSRTGMGTQPAKAGQNPKLTQNPQTDKPGLPAPPWQGAVSKKGVDLSKHDSKLDEEGTRPGLHPHPGTTPLAGKTKK